MEKQYQSPESCSPEAPNQDPGRRRSVGALGVDDLQSESLQTWESYLANDPKERVYKLNTTIWSIHIWIQYYHRDLAWSSNQPGLLVQFFFLQSIIRVFFCCNMITYLRHPSIEAHLFRGHTQQEMLWVPSNGRHRATSLTASVFARSPRSW